MDNWGIFMICITISICVNFICDMIESIFKSKYDGDIISQDIDINEIEDKEEEK